MPAGATQLAELLSAEEHRQVVRFLFPIDDGVGVGLKTAGATSSTTSSITSTRSRSNTPRNNGASNAGPTFFNNIKQEIDTIGRETSSKTS